jgi:hypothetical protein
MVGRLSESHLHSEQGRNPLSRNGDTHFPVPLEQVSKAVLDQLQRPPGSSQLIVERRFA